MIDRMPADLIGGDALAAAVALIAHVEPGIDPTGTLHILLWPFADVPVEGDTADLLRAARDLIDREIVSIEQQTAA